MMKFAYQNKGGPMSWKHGPPSPAGRAADNRSLGSLSGTVFDGPSIVLPKPGAPEVIPMSGVALGDVSVLGTPMGLARPYQPTTSMAGMGATPLGQPRGQAHSYESTTAMSGLGDCGCHGGGGSSVKVKFPTGAIFTIGAFWLAAKILAR